MVIIVPFFYAISFLFAFVKSIIEILLNETTQHYREKVTGVFLSLFFWIIGLSVITFLKGGQVLEHSVTNAGFLIMTIIFIRSSIIESKLEYQKLLKTERKLQQVNKKLQTKKERTREMEAVISNSAVKDLTGGMSKKETRPKNEIYENNCEKYHITEREQEIIDLISCGLTYKEISLQLNLSEKTLVKHRVNIFKKVKVNKKRDLLKILFNQTPQTAKVKTIH